jgi:hypothetical protein
MNLQEEIANVARELYEKSGRIEGRDRENWLDAERIVLSRHASQDMEEPEGEEALIEEETIAEEVEGTEPEHASQEKEEEDETTVIEEIEVREPFIAKKKGSRITEMAEKIMLAKKGGSGKKAAAPKRERSKKKT